MLVVGRPIYFLYMDIFMGMVWKCRRMDDTPSSPPPVMSANGVGISCTSLSIIPQLNMDPNLYCQDSEVEVAPPTVAHIYGPNNVCVGRCCAPPSRSLHEMAQLRAKLREERKTMGDFVVKDGIWIRKFEMADQLAVATLFLEGLTSYRDSNTMYKLQCWFTHSKLKEGGDMFDIFSYYIDSSDVLDRNFWVAEVIEGDNVGAIVGCVAAMKHEEYVSTSTDPNRPDVEEEKALELVRMSVDKRYRKKKLGTRLLQAFEKFARDRKYGVIRLSTLDLMEPAKKLYLSSGFDLDSTRDLDVSTILEDWTEDDLKIIRICNFVKRLSN